MSLETESLVLIVPVARIREGRVLVGVDRLKRLLETLPVDRVVVEIGRTDVVEGHRGELGRTRFPILSAEALSVTRNRLVQRTAQVFIQDLVTRDIFVIIAGAVCFLPLEHILEARITPCIRLAHRGAVMDQLVEGREILVVFGRVARDGIVDRPHRDPRQVEQSRLGRAAVRGDEELGTLEVFGQLIGRNRPTFGVRKLVRSPVGPHDDVVDRGEEGLLVGDETVFLFLATGVDDPRARLGSATHDPGNDVEKHLHGVPVVHDIEHAGCEGGDQVGGGRVPGIALPLFLGRLVSAHVHVEFASRFGNVPSQPTRVGVDVQLGRLVVGPKGETGHHGILGRRRPVPGKNLEGGRRICGTGIVQHAKGSIGQLVDPLHRHRDMPVAAFTHARGFFPDRPCLRKLATRQLIVAEPLNTVLILAKSLGPLRDRRGIGMDDRVINLLPPDDGFVQIHEMIRFGRPTLKIGEITLEIRPGVSIGIDLHPFVGVEFVGKRSTSRIIPLPDRPGLGGPGLLGPDGGRLANLGDHEIHSLLADLLGLEPLRIGARGPMLAGRQREEGQHEDGREGHHGEDGDEGDASTILGEKPTGLEGFRKFHGWDGVGSRERGRAVSFWAPLYDVN